MDEQAKTLVGQFLVNAHQGFRGRFLQEGPCRGVERRSQEIVGGRIADVELDSLVQLGYIDQVGLLEQGVLFLGWFGG